MNGELDPRVQELCAQIQRERDQARMLKLITELNDILDQPARQLRPDANLIATDTRKDTAPPFPSNSDAVVNIRSNEGRAAIIGPTLKCL